jgi:hypothetical protein
MKAVGNHIITIIDKKAQNALQEKLGNIYIPPNYVFMKYNLQFGPIISISKGAAKAFPKAEVGDLAIFHHSVEANYNHFITLDQDGDELRAVRVYSEDDPASHDNQLYAIVKQDGTLITHPDWNFLSPKMESINVKFDSGILEVDKSIYTEEKYMVLQMNLLGRYIDSLQATARNIRDIGRISEINEKCREYQGMRDKLSRIIASEKVAYTTVLHCPDNSVERFGYGQGDIVAVTHADGLIPLSFQNRLYFLAMTQYVVGISN